MDLRNFANENEKPLDNIVADGGYCSIFRRIACIGDSLSSGEFEAIEKETEKKIYYDRYEYSWGQFLGRMCGSTVLNFSRGGMTAKEYCEKFAESRGFWNPEEKCQAYIFALGANDLNYDPEDNSGDRRIGSLEDVCMEDWRKNQRSFAGFFGQILQRYREIEPNSFFFLITFPKSDIAAREKRSQAHRALMYDFAKAFRNTYVIDLYQYAPIYDEEFRKKFFLLGHMNPLGYLLTGKMVASYIDYIIRHDPSTFGQVGFIGSPYQMSDLSYGAAEPQR